MAVSNILNADELTTGIKVDDSYSSMQVMEAAQPPVIIGDFRTPMEVRHDFVTAAGPIQATAKGSGPSNIAQCVAVADEVEGEGYTQPHYSNQSQLVTDNTVRPTQDMEQSYAYNQALGANAAAGSGQYHNLVPIRTANAACPGQAMEQFHAYSEGYMANADGSRSQHTAQTGYPGYAPVGQVLIFGSCALYSPMELGIVAGHCGNFHQMSGSGARLHSDSPQATGVSGPAPVIEVTDGIIDEQEELDAPENPSSQPVGQQVGQLLGMNNEGTSGDSSLLAASNSVAANEHQAVQDESHSHNEAQDASSQYAVVPAGSTIDATDATSDNTVDTVNNTAANPSGAVVAVAPISVNPEDPQANRLRRIFADANKPIDLMRVPNRSLTSVPAKDHDAMLTYFLQEYARAIYLRGAHSIWYQWVHKNSAKFGTYKDFFHQMKSLLSVSSKICTANKTRAKRAPRHRLDITPWRPFAEWLDGFEAATKHLRASDSFARFAAAKKWIDEVRRVAKEQKVEARRQMDECMKDMGLGGQAYTAMFLGLLGDRAAKVGEECYGKGGVTVDGKRPRIGVKERIASIRKSA